MNIRDTEPNHAPTLLRVHTCQLREELLSLLTSTLTSWDSSRMFSSQLLNPLPWKQIPTSLATWSAARSASSPGIAWNSRSICSLTLSSSSLRRRLLSAATKVYEQDIHICVSLGPALPVAPARVIVSDFRILTARTSTSSKLAW